MAIAVRNTRKAKQFRKEPSTAQYIPYSEHVTDHIISTTDGRYLTVLKISGRVHETASNAELLNWHRDLNQLLKNIGDEHLQIWTHQYHHAVHDYHRAQHELSFAKRFEDSYAKLFEDMPLMVNDLYLTLLYNPIGDFTQKFLAKFERPSIEQLLDMKEESLAKLEEYVDQVLGVMRPYGISRLGVYYRDKNGQVVQEPDQEPEDDDDDGDLLAITDTTEPETPEPAAQFAFSSALEWLGFLANGDWALVPIGRSGIRTTLMRNRPVSSLWGDVIQLRTVDSAFYTAAVEIRDYDANTEPGQMNLLMELPFDYVLTQSFSCMSMGSARHFLSVRQQELMETRDPSETQIQEMAIAADDLVSRRFVMGYHHATVHVFGSTAKQAQKRAREARVSLSQCAIVATPVGLASEAAYWAKLPGNATFIPRPVPINSWNFLCFSPFHNFHSGKPSGNPWGDAVMLFKSVAGTPLFFNFHVTPEGVNSYGKRPAGSTLILGRTGSGKTTLLNALLTMATRYKPRMFIFDKDQGMKPLVRALRGHYNVVKEGEPSGWQPFQLEPTAANIAMCRHLVQVCAETSLGRPLDHQDVQAIGAAVAALMSEDSQIERSMRNFSTLVQHIPAASAMFDHGKPSLVSLLEPWCRGGEHGWLFDNDEDSLDLAAHDIYGFDITDFISAKEEEAPPTRTPMLMYLQYRIRSSIDGKRRSIQVFDEFAQYLDDPVLAREVKRGLKTDRKKDCIYLFATQEPNDALDSTIGKTIVQAVVTLLLLENPGADPRDYIEKLGLTESEYAAFRAIPENSRQFLVKQGSKSAMAQMVLRDMEEEISILSGTPDNAERMDNIIESLGTDDPDVWMPVYWDDVLKRQQENQR